MKAILLAASLFAALPSAPDPTLSPGVIDARVTQENIQRTICRRAYTATVRKTPPALKSLVYREYAINRRSVHAEIDHRVPLELGGADVRKNLWPQDYDSWPWNARRKDGLENFIHRAVCAGRMSLADGQAIFMGDWAAAYARTKP